MNGTITSPGYPENYKSNVNCTMTIVAPVPDHQIMIHFTSLEIEDSKKCSFDSVSLFLDSYSGIYRYVFVYYTKVLIQCC